ncbi:acyltransferase [Empedobacter falsenii]|uniref:Acyltransferase n=1 Tax=Empedobacter falsenii TaxID=343874 RepID=A0A3R8SN88_9FLAO|nr:acyltransferase [Empedobacter falsenii]RRT93467.1 acyltransferase [Empedobacter falsenii]RRT93613.1 acyltransferase [Empedobacter falsenii]
MSSGRSKFKKNKFIINIIYKFFVIIPKFIKIFLWNIITSHTQIFFIGIRYILLKSLIKKCGDNIKIGPNVQIIGWENLVIGSNVSIHANSYIDATGGIIIEDYVSIAHNSTILSSNHDWKDNTLPIKYNPIITNSVVIKKDVWIGCACRILSGVVINSRSIVAAGAVVNRDVESKTIVGGIPAKKIKEI